MHPNRYTLLLAAALGAALAAPVSAQDATTPAPADEAPAEAPAADAPAEAPAAEAPAAAPETDTPPAAPAETPAVEGATPPAGETATPPAGGADPTAPEAAAPAEPTIDVVQQGDWEVGCLAGTNNCEMQQIAADASGNPVVLVRVVKLPENADARALVIFNTPLGTLLPPGLGFQIDAAPSAALPFEWCVQEGCIVRLGLRDEDVAAMKRGNVVRLSVTSIGDVAAPVQLDLSLTGFTAAYDSLAVPATSPEPAAAAPAPADPAASAPAPAAPASPAPAPAAPAPEAPAPEAPAQE